MTKHRALLVSAGLALLGLSPQLAAQSFTLDFQHPNGAGSAFPDAIDLSTQGAQLDSQGKPLGFTRDSFDTTVTTIPATLTAAGLEFGPNYGYGLCLPFPTDGVGTVEITVRIASMAGMDANFDGIAVGIGTELASTNNALNAVVFHNTVVQEGPIVYQVCASPNVAGNHRFVTGEQAIRTITLSAATIPGALATGIFDGDSIDLTIDTIHDNLADSRLGRPDTFAHLWAGGVAATVTSISFSGPNVVAPPPAEPLGGLFDLINDVYQLNLAQGIVNTLDSKLDAAVDALSDAVTSNDVAAAGALGAFINAVQAQSGKKIPAEDADDLIATANFLISLLIGP